MGVFSLLPAETAAATLWQLVALWLLGALCGWLLPRSNKNSSGASSGSAAWLNAAVSSVLPSSRAVRRAALAMHGAIIAREVWYHWTQPGTFRSLFAAVCGALAGKGWHFDFPMASQPGLASGTPCDASATRSPAAIHDSWYVTAADLEFFQRTVEQEPGQGKPPPGYGAWELLMDREIAGLVKYTAWRRSLPNGKTEYRSLTISPDATAQEFMDMYFDDDNRPNWDTMIIGHEVLEHGAFAQRQQVVRWVRRFPFSFISDREYVIAKRLFAEDDVLYGITKAVDHPRAPPGADVVRAEVFYSMWRSRTVACPWGSGRPACQTLLLHHEQMKVPENLARFAVKHGMWGFVRKLSTETPKFVEARRKRCDPYSADPQAFGAGFAPNPPAPPGGMGGPFAMAHRMRRTDTAASALSSLTAGSSGVGGGERSELLHRASTGGLGAAGRTRSGKLRGLAAFALASGLAMLVKRSNSSERLPVGPGGQPLQRRAGSANSLRRLRRARTEMRLTDAALLDGGGMSRSAVAIAGRRAASSALSSDGVSG